MGRWIRALMIAVLAPLALSGCLFFPGHFESALTIHADRSFTFTYKGEVLAIDIEAMMGKVMGMGMAAGAQARKGASGKTAPPDFTLTPEEQAKQDDQFRKLAADLAKEYGYRSVEYRGEGVFFVDYAISGTLDHGFIWPYNADNHIVMPWVLVDLRGRDLIRIKTPGYARPDPSGMGLGDAGSSLGPMASLPFPGAKDPLGRLDGTFTLTTDAELVSQNNLEGATTAGAVKTVTWHVDSHTADAPLASIRVAPLPDLPVASGH